MIVPVRFRLRVPLRKRTSTETAKHTVGCKIQSLRPQIPNLRMASLLGTLGVFDLSEQWWLLRTGFAQALFFPSAHTSPKSVAN